MRLSTGSKAGIVWQYLKLNEKATIAQIEKNTGLNKIEINRVAGWLLCEDKIINEKKSRSEVFSIK